MWIFQIEIASSQWVSLSLGWTNGTSLAKIPLVLLDAPCRCVEAGVPRQGGAPESLAEPTIPTLQRIENLANR